MFLVGRKTSLWRTIPSLLKKRRHRGGRVLLLTGNRLDVFAVLCVLSLFLNWPGKAQTTGESVYYRNFVRHSSGEFCQHTAPIATFTAFLNRDQRKVLVENAPRWDIGGDPNIDGRGTFGVELGNFVDPSLAVGDSVFVRFTCNATQQQRLLADSVASIPWSRFPLTLSLSPVILPAPPQNVALVIEDSTRRVLSWTQEGGMTYTVYRRSLQDTLFSGQTRKLYTRITDIVSGGSFTDTTGPHDNTYAYIVYAKSPESVFSSHSQEITGTDRIRNLTIFPRASTTVLSWNVYLNPLGPTKGYNIYRRTQLGSYGSPVAYGGLDTVYIDSRLQLGTTYFYKIKARADAEVEFGESDEVAVTTPSSRLGFYTFASLKVAVVIYKNTNGGTISNSEVVKINTMLDVAKLFYWRNSGMKLNLEFSYYPIDEYKDFGDPDNTNVQQTVSDLRQLGVVNTQYDIIFRISPAVNGFWSYGVLALNLPGPFRETGFSHSDWPIGTGVVYPGNLPGINYGLTWIFLHEAQHAIDALYDVNGHPEMYHGDQPFAFPVAAGEHYDFQAKMLRSFDAFEDLLNNWGDIYEAVDQDLDGFPDDEPLVALDEARFESDPTSIDTDNDSHTDMQEAIDGTYSGSDPNKPDSDGDGILDGQDPFARYPVKKIVEKFTPTIDGIVEEGWPLVDDTVSFTQQQYSPRLYMAYDENYLYVALYLENRSVPILSFDFDADGWWWGRGNTMMTISPSQGRFSSFRSWDAGPGARAYSPPDGMWDDEPDYVSVFGRRVISPSDVRLMVTSEFPVVQAEMAIPKNDYAGLRLLNGDSLGFNITYSVVNSDAYQWAVTFDQYSFVNVVLGGSIVAVDRAGGYEPPEQFALLQNYPNPFNATTRIRYQLPVLSVVELAIYNLLGEKVRSLVNQSQNPGVYSVTWDGTNDAGVPTASGVYFYHLKAGGYTQIQKMMLLR